MSARHVFNFNGFYATRSGCGKPTLLHLGLLPSSKKLLVEIRPDKTSVILPGLMPRRRRQIIVNPLVYQDAERDPSRPGRHLIQLMQADIQCSRESHIYTGRVDGAAGKTLIFSRLSIAILFISLRKWIRREHIVVGGDCHQVWRNLMTVLVRHSQATTNFDRYSERLTTGVIGRRRRQRQPG